MEISEIKRYLANQAEDVCQVLLPSGKRSNREWVAGSVSGEAGKSLKVSIHGSKAGIWSDFATGDSGDLIDLWIKCRNLTLADALKDIRQHYRLAAPEFQSAGVKKYQAAIKPSNRKSNPVVEYLTQQRQLKPETLKSFGVESDGEYYYLPSLKDGELVRWKKISIHRPDGKKKMYVSPETKPILFGWQALDPNAKEVIITEGEIDAMTAHQLGYPALSIPLGTGNGSKLDWIHHDWHELERFEAIYICMDNDEAGQGSVSEIAERLGLHRCYRINLPKNDINECLMAGVGQEALGNALQEAKEFRPEALRSVIDYQQDVVGLFCGGESEKGSPLRYGRGGDFCFRPAEMTLWTGTNGHGKSMMLGQVLLDMMLLNEERACVASMEMKPRRLLHRLTRQATAMREPSTAYINKVFEALADKLWIYDHLGTVKPDHLMEVFTYARKRYGVTHFVIDSLMKCGIAMDDYKGQKVFIDRLCQFMHTHNCHVHLVAHPRKGDDEYKMPGKLDVAGSVDIVNQVDNQICVWRNKAKEEDQAAREPKEAIQKQPDGKIGIYKQRNGEWEGTIGLWYDQESFQYVSSPSFPPKRYVQFSGDPFANAAY
jgi:twinkle protein